MTVAGADEGNFIETLRSAAADRLDTPFLIEPTGTSTGYGEMFARAAAMAAELETNGVRPGDRVVVQIAKSTDAVVLYLACLHAGGVYVPLNPSFTAAELRYFVDDADPALVVREESDATDARVGGVHTTIQALAAGSDTAAEIAPADRRGDDLAALLYTSGTTGQPKGAALTHDNLRHNASALHRVWEFSPDDHLLHILPIFHVHGLFVALHCAMLSAIPVTFLPRFDVDAVVDAIPDASVLMGVPTHYVRLLAEPRFDASLVEGVRLFTSGSAPLSEAVFAAFEERTGARICERYGMSEAGIISSNPASGARLPGTVGFALPGVEIRVGDGFGNEHRAGTSGSVEIRGPHLFHGYWDQPTATAKSHLDGGWFITGDVGILDESGRLTLQGRAGDMIISGGENVFPKDVELVLDTVAGVVESTVIGLPHPDLGEAVTAVLVIEDGFDSSAIATALDGGLARFKHPKAHITVDELPRNTMGKVQRQLLRDRLRGHYSTGP